MITIIFPQTSDKIIYLHKLIVRINKFRPSLCEVHMTCILHIEERTVRNQLLYSFNTINYDNYLRFILFRFKRDKLGLLYKI